LLATCFEAERAAQDAAVAELRASRVFIRSVPPGLTTTADPTAATIRPAPHEKPSRWGLVALACALAMAVASVIAVRHSSHGGASVAAGAVHQQASPVNPAVSAPSPAVDLGSANDGGASRSVP
jgi:hypothetical protein